MGRNFNAGDKVIAVEEIGSGVSKGTHGVVTHVSVFHGMLTVRFDNGAEIKNVKFGHVAHA